MAGEAGHQLTNNAADLRIFPSSERERGQERKREQHEDIFSEYSTGAERLLSVLQLEL